MGQKSILLIVRSNSAEIDWILPVLYELKKKYLIYTIFDKENSFNDLKKNKELFILWKKVCKKYFIKKKTDNILIRSFLFLIYFFKLENYIYSIKDFLNQKIFSEKIIKNKLGVQNLNNIKYIFHDFGAMTGWVNLFEKKKTKIVYFPHTSINYYNKGKNKQRLIGDYMILGTKKDVSYWSKSFFGKILVFGHLKYHRNWLKNLKFKNNKYASKKIKIALPLKDFVDLKEKKKLEKILFDVFQVLKEYKDSIFLYIKPSRKNTLVTQNLVHKILGGFEINYKFISNNLLSISKFADLFLIFGHSGVGLDALSNKKPSIELWNKNLAISPVNNYVFQAKNKQILDKTIKKYLNGGLDNKLNLKFKRFKKDYLNQIKMNEISKFF